MRKNSRVLVCILLMFCFSVSCMHYDEHSTSIQLSDSDNYYTMIAHFNTARTSDIENYMDDKIGKASNMSFRHSEIDASMTMDDKMNFHIRKDPGYIKIEFDKRKNSMQSLQKIKSMCEGIKDILSKK